MTDGEEKMAERGGGGITLRHACRMSLCSFLPGFRGARLIPITRQLQVRLTSTTNEHAESQATKKAS